MNKEKARFYPLIDAANREEAIAAVEKLCQCIKQSFSGVVWCEEGEELRGFWEEMEAK